MMKVPLGGPGPGGPGAYGPIEGGGAMPRCAARRASAALRWGLDFFEPPRPPGADF
jgi:hypothetical protein